MWRKAAFRATILVGIAMARVAEAQEPVLLRLHPRLGDTLHTLLEQQTEVSMPEAAGKSSVTSVAIHSQTIVRAVQATSTVVLTIVDSARLSSSDSHTAAALSNARRTLEGQQLMLQLGADGTVEWARDRHGVLMAREVTEAMSAMPAVFPRKAVSVGEQWTREMPLPQGGALGARGSGKAKAVFRLDSLNRNGSIAYVSMHGEILPDSVSHGVELNGTITGTLQLDRSRGWMTDSRFLIILKALVTPPPSSGVAPMRFLTRVTQRLRTMDKR